MQYSISLIDRAAEICGSRYKLSKRINVPQSHLSEVHHGKRRLPLDWVFDLAEIVGEDKEQALKLVTMERTKSEEKRSRLGKLVAAGVVGMWLISYGNDSLSQPVTYSLLHQPLKSNATVCTSYCFARRITRRLLSVFRTRWLTWFVVPKPRPRIKSGTAYPVRRPRQVMQLPACLVALA